MTLADVALDNECFYIGPIGAEGSAERGRSDGVFEFIVKRAASEIGLTAIRADHIAEPGQITLQIIDHVLRAKAAVVDLTGLNPNVFYEMAVRHAAKMPVALIADKGCKLPFDIAQMRTIFFDHTNLASADACRAGIVAHLNEAIDKGLVDSPIATTLDVRTMQSGSAVERNIAELVTSVEEIARSQRQIFSAIREPGSGVGSVAAQAIRDLMDSYRLLLSYAESNNDAELSEIVEGLERPVTLLARRFRYRLPRGEGSGKGIPIEGSGALAMDREVE